MISNNNANLYLVFIKKINKKNNVFIYSLKQLMPKIIQYYGRYK